LKISIDRSRARGYTLTVKVENRASLPDDTLAAIESRLPESGTLMEFIGWGLDQDPPVMPVETVALDEYSHDVIFRGHDGFILVIGST